MGTGYLSPPRTPFRHAATSFPWSSVGSRCSKPNSAVWSKLSRVDLPMDKERPTPKRSVSARRVMTESVVSVWSCTSRSSGGRNSVRGPEADDVPVGVADVQLHHSAPGALARRRAATTSIDLGTGGSSRVSVGQRVRIHDGEPDPWTPAKPQRPSPPCQVPVRSRARLFLARFAGSHRLVAGPRLRRVARSRNFIEQRACARNPCAQRMHSSPQPRVGRVDQSRRRIRKRIDQIHDSVVSPIPAAMSGVDHGEAVLGRKQVRRPGPVEHDRPVAAAAPRHRSDVGDEPPRSLGTVAPPTVRTRSHHVVSVHDHRARHRVNCAAKPRATTHAVFRGKANCYRNGPPLPWPYAWLPIPVDHLPE